MRIQTNTAANSALGYMRVNSQNTERSIQKLSSGFRINRAADDAAGLAIANQLRADAKTLGQAQKNAAQAGAMLQIADGAAGTLGGIFDRMRELASQGASANIGAATNAAKLQDEWNALYSEADRIITGTKYQGTNVLTGLRAQPAQAVQDGSGSAITASGATAANGLTSVTGTSGAVRAANGTYKLTSSNGNVTLTMEGTTGPAVTQTLSSVANGAGTLDFSTLGVRVAVNASFRSGTAISAANGTVTAGTGATTANGFASATSSSTTANGTYNITQTGQDITLTNAATGATQTLLGTAAGAGPLTFSSLGITITANANYGAGTLNGAQITVAGAQPAVAAGAGSLDQARVAVTGRVDTVTAASDAPSILVGTSASQGGSYAGTDSISLQLGTLGDNAIRNLSGAGNFEAGGNVNGASLLTTAGAQDALTRLDAALGSLNTFVGKLGAAQSRVDYATQNVNSMLQNTLAAESSIRDADMAAEMTTFTKNNILQQAAQSMLAQANQGTQGILQLLRG